MKNILILTDDIFTYSGREKVCSQMVDIFSEKNTVEIVSLNGTGDPFYNISKARKIISLQGKLLKMYRLFRLVIKGDYDYIFIATMGKLSVWFLPVMLACRLFTKCKFYSCEHVSLLSLSFIVRFIRLFLFRLYSGVIVLTEQDCSRYRKWRIKSHVIENYIDFKGIHKKEIFFKALAVGRLNKQKNFSELIDIWYDFKKNDKSGWVLYIAGEGEERDALEKKIINLNIGESIKLLGKVDNVDYLYRTSDLCLMTSLYEGLPLALLEAKSYSLPCIAYDCNTGPREIIVNDVDGYLIEQFDHNGFVNKLSILTSEPITYFKFSENAKVKISDFSYSKIKSKWLEVIEGAF